MRGDVLSRLIKLMEEHGFRPNRAGRFPASKLMPGRPISFDTGTSKKKKYDSAGFLEYSELEDGIRGYFGSFKGGEDGASASSYVPFFIPFDPDEDARAKRRAPNDPERIKREKELQAVREEAVKSNREAAEKAALRIWDVGGSFEANPYLKRKGVLDLLHPEAVLTQISSDQVKPITGYTPSRGGDLLSGELLVVPLSDAKGNFVNVELIDPTGIKVGLRGGPRKGAFWVTRPISDGITIGVAEGVATAITLSAALDIPLVSVGGCPFFDAALEGLKEALPRARFVVFSDLGNGQLVAAEAAAKHGAAFLAPPPRVAAAGGSDYNDLMAQEGLEAVKAHAGSVLMQAEVDPDGLPGLPPGTRRVDLGAVSELPVMDYVLPGLRAGNVGLLVGQGGAGKSYLCLELGMAIATGRLPPWLEECPGEFTPKAGKVGLLFGEDDDDVIASRAIYAKRAISEYADPEYQSLLSKNVYTYGLVGHDMRISVEDRYEIRDGEFMKSLEIFCTGKRLVVVDPLARLMDGDENDNRAAGAMMNRLVGIAHRTRCAILIIHHISKGGASKNAESDPDDWASARGASALTTSVRFQLNFRPVIQKEFERLCEPGEELDSAKPLYVALTATKVNYGPWPERAFLKKVAGGALIPAIPRKDGSGLLPPPPSSGTQRPRRPPAAFGDSLAVDD